MADEVYEDLLRNVLVSQSCLSASYGEPSLLIHALYIGGQRNAENYGTLERLGITHVVNCAGYKGHRSYQGSPYEGLDIKYLEFLADDTDHYDITQHFRQAFAFIHRARKGGGVVLVHCAMGINRSGATCLAYIMMMTKKNIIKTAIMMKSKRRVLLSNIGFQKRLVKLARMNGLLDDLESSYIQTFVISKRRHRSSSSSRFHELPDKSSSQTTFTGDSDFSSSPYTSYSTSFSPSIFHPSTYQPLNLFSTHGYHRDTHVPTVLTADEILSKLRLNFISKASHQYSSSPLYRKSVCL